MGTLFYEHLAFYSLSTISVLLERHGFHVVDAERLPMHGGSLRVTASRKRAASCAEVEAILNYEKETGLNEPESWRRFGVQSLRKIGIVKDVLGALIQKHTIWGSGAAG